MGKTCESIHAILSPIVKILFVLEHFPPMIGGVERLFGDLTSRLAAKDFKVEVITLRLPGTPAYEIKDGVKIHRLRLWNRYLFGFFSFFAVLRYGRSADIIHTTTYNAAPISWLVAKLLRKPVVITVHEVLGNNWFHLPHMSRVSAYFHRLFERWLLKLSFNRYICVSEATKRDLLKYVAVDPNKVQVICNGIDYAEWKHHEISRDRPIHHFLFYGRPGFTKGLDVLLSAWKKITAEHPLLKLMLIISDHPKKPFLQTFEHIRKLGIENSVIVQSSLPKEELLRAIVAVDAVVIPSRTEGFGFNIAENAALGTNMVATNAGSIPEVISGRFILCQPGDSESLTEALLKASRNEFQETPLKRFDIATTVENYVQVYQVLAKRDT